MFHLLTTTHSLPALSQSHFLQDAIRSTWKKTSICILNCSFPNERNQPELLHCISSKGVAPVAVSTVIVFLHVCAAETESEVTGSEVTGSDITSDVEVGIKG